MSCSGDRSNARDRPGESAFAGRLARLPPATTAYRGTERAARTYNPAPRSGAGCGMARQGVGASSMYLSEILYWGG